MTDRSIPCGFCNMLAYDLGITEEELKKAGAIKDGVMLRHLGRCPEVLEVRHSLARVVSNEDTTVVNFWAEITRGWKSMWPFG